MYKYLIAYNYTDQKGFGFGNCDYIVNEKIKDSKDIDILRDKIKKQGKNYKEVVILNYKLLKEK